MIKYTLPALFLIFSNISFENNLKGLWKSTDDNLVQYLKFSDDGSLTRVSNLKKLFGRLL